MQCHGATLICPCHSDLEFENLVRAVSRKLEGVVDTW